MVEVPGSKIIELYYFNIGVTQTVTLIAFGKLVLGEVCLTPAHTVVRVINDDGGLLPAVHIASILQRLNFSEQLVIGTPRNQLGANTNQVLFGGNDSVNPVSMAVEFVAHNNFGEVVLGAKVIHAFSHESFQSLARLVVTYAELRGTCKSDSLESGFVRHLRIANSW